MKRYSRASSCVGACMRGDCVMRDEEAFCQAVVLLILMLVEFVYVGSGIMLVDRNVHEG